MWLLDGRCISSTNWFKMFIQLQKKGWWVRQIDLLTMSKWKKRILKIANVSLGIIWQKSKIIFPELITFYNEMYYRNSLMQRLDGATFGALSNERVKDATIYFPLLLWEELWKIMIGLLDLIYLLQKWRDNYKFSEMGYVESINKMTGANQPVTIKYPVNQKALMMLWVVFKDDNLLTNNIKTFNIFSTLNQNLQNLWGDAYDAYQAWKK